MNFLFAQAPNRKGNQSKDPAKHSGGVTAVTRSAGSLFTPAGSQGKAPAGGDATCGRHQKVAVSYGSKATGGGEGYMSKSTKNYLK